MNNIGLGLREFWQQLRAPPDALMLELGAGGELLVAKLRAALSLALLLLPLAALSVLLLLVYGPIRADADGIWMDGSLESVGMAWADVKQVRFGRFQLVLEGGSKRLVLPKPCFWTGVAAHQVRDYLQMLARDYCTPPPPSRTADLVLSRNVVRVAPPTLK